MTDRVTFAGIMAANHAQDDARVAALIAKYNGILAGANTPNPDYEIGGGSGALCDCVDVTFTTELQVVGGGSGSTFITLVDNNTAPAEDGFKFNKYYSTFQAPVLAGIAQPITFDLTGLPVGTYQIQQEVITDEGAVIGSGISVQWDGLQITAVSGGLAINWDYEVSVGALIPVYIDGVFDHYEDLAGNTVTPTGTPKKSCKPRPAYNFELDWENQRSTQIKFDMIEAASESIAIDDTTVQSLTVPADALGARVYFEGNGEIRIFADGQNPNVNVGIPVCDGDQIELGCTPDKHSGDVQELANFRAIATTGVSGTLIINYYKRQI